MYSYSQWNCNSVLWQYYKHFPFSIRILTPNTRLVVRKEKKNIVLFRNATTIKENHEIFLPNLAMVKLCLIFLSHSSLFLVFNDLLVLNSHNKCQNNQSIGTQVRFFSLFNRKQIHLLFSSHIQAALEGLSHWKCLRSDFKVYVSASTIVWADI